MFPYKDLRVNLILNARKSNWKDVLSSRFTDDRGQPDERLKTAATCGHPLCMLNLEQLAGLFAEHQGEFTSPVAEFSIGSRPFPFNSEPAIMGVVNLSRDSWYRESVALSVASAAERARVLHAQGAAIIDLGVESTLGHAERVGEHEQLTRLRPLLEELRPDRLLLSVETYEPAVARGALELGASIINLTGPARSAEIYQAVAEHDAAVIICYVEGANVREVGDFNLTGDPIPRMREFFAREVERATGAGARKIFIDPGLGFYYRNLQDSAVRVRMQALTFLNTFRLRSLGWPVCHALPHAFEFFREEVRSAEPFFAVLAALGKTDLFRTHEVPKIRAVLETLRAAGAPPLKP